MKKEDIKVGKRIIFIAKEQVIWPHAGTILSIKNNLIFQVKWDTGLKIDYSLTELNLFDLYVPDDMS